MSLHAMALKKSYTTLPIQGSQSFSEQSINLSFLIPVFINLFKNKNKEWRRRTVNILGGRKEKNLMCSGDSRMSSNKENPF